jgi:hypothetical protein
MGLFEMAQRDFAKFSSDTVAGPAKAITFTAPNSGPIIVANGIATKHHNSLNEEGKQVNAKKASITITEALLTAQGYPVRIKGEVNLTNHKVSWMDSTGTINTYMIREWYPDESLGEITCILGDFE